MTIFTIELVCMEGRERGREGERERREREGGRERRREGERKREGRGREGRREVGTCR